MDSQSPGAPPDLSVAIARHGETEWNVVGRRQGQLDSALTPRGRGQAQTLARWAAREAVDGLLTSPLGRAVETATICAIVLHMQMEVLDDLREVDHGTFAGLTTAQIEAHAPGALAQRAADKYRWRFPGGESYADADARAGNVARAIITRHLQRPLIVTHEMVGRMLRRALLNADASAALAWRQPHDTVYVIDPAARSDQRVDLAPSAS